MPRPLLARLLRLRLWLTERITRGETLLIYLWAGLVGCLGGLAALLFRWVCDALQTQATGSSKPWIDAAADQPSTWLVLVPAIGGLIAGLVLQFGSRFTRGRRAADYMEAVSLGDGVIRSRPTLVRVVSSVFSIASGGSIGREGPMVQLAAMIASRVGKLARFPTPRLRLLVACGAAAGIASAYNAPIGGALFVAEIVLGSIAMESFGPLLFASFMATVVARALLGGAPLFTIPAFKIVSLYELPAYLALGLLLGALAPAFLWLLEASGKAFARINAPLYLRMALGGACVGAISIHHPYVLGNGYGALSLILSTDWIWSALLVLVVFKLAATCATVGSGAVGGVFTPTLLIGAAIGGLVGTSAHALAPSLTAPAHAYSLVGMGAFLAATTHAPFMANLMLFDMTLSHEIVLPLMLACVSAVALAQALQRNSIYSRSLKPKESEAAEVPLALLRVRDLMRPDPPSVGLEARFTEIVGVFAKNRHQHLYVVGPAGEFRGAIPLHEIKPLLNDADLANVVIAEDIVKDDFLRVRPDSELSEALEKFMSHPGERLPVVGPSSDGAGVLLGSISKTDLMLTLAHGGRAKPDA